MTRIEEIENPERWSKWWFLAGGNIHRLWKSKNYTAIKDAASTLPKSAWDTQQAEINYLLDRVKVLEEVRAAAEKFTDPKTQLLIVTAHCAFFDLKDALAKTEVKGDKT